MHKPSFRTHGVLSFAALLAIPIAMAQPLPKIELRAVFPAAKFNLPLWMEEANR